MSSTNRLLTTTQDFLLPKVVDTILNGNVFFSRIVRAAKKWNGEQMKFPVKVSKNTTGTSFNGYDTFSTAATDSRVRLTYDPKFYQISVSLPLTEIAVNATEAGVIKLADIEMASAANDMADDLGTIFYSDGTGNGSKDQLGLAAIVDDGTTAGTIGGLSRTTYTSLKSTVTASGGTLTLAKMATLWNNCTHGSSKPTVILTTPTVFSLYEQLIEPKVHIQRDVSMVKGVKGGAGFTGLDYKGVPVLSDDKATSGVMFMLNEDFIDFYGLPMAETEAVNYKSQSIEGNDYSSLSGLGFSFSGWIKPTNAATIVGHIFFGGELIARDFRTHGKLTGITGV